MDYGLMFGGNLWNNKSQSDEILFQYPALKHSCNMPCNLMTFSVKTFTRWLVMYQSISYSFSHKRAGFSRKRSKLPE